jgi:hypothetical protein
MPEQDPTLPFNLCANSWICTDYTAILRQDPGTKVTVRADSGSSLDPIDGEWFNPVAAGFQEGYFCGLNPGCVET